MIGEENRKIFKEIKGRWVRWAVKSYSRILILAVGKTVSVGLTTLDLKTIFHEHPRLSKKRQGLR